MKNLGVKRATKPSEGVYYAVPTNSQMTTWDIVSKRADEVSDGELEPLHFNLWEYACIKMENKLKIDAFEFEDNYTGLPRGRIMHREDGIWEIQHGNDTPSSIKHLVLAEFGLLALANEKKAVWVFNEHEVMDPKEKKIVWGIITGKKK